MKLFFLSIFSFFSISLFAQDDLLKMLDTVGTKDKALNKVTATFKDTKIINMQTEKTMGAGELNFGISHRFGNAGTASNGGVHTLYGWGAIADVRLGLDYGITRTLQVGVGRSNRQEAIDVNLKWRFFEQTLDNKIPLSVCAYSIVSLTPELASQLYSGADTAFVAKNKKLADRFIYTSQLILTRKFANWLSVAISPTYTHRNYVLANVNPYNKAVDENDLFSLAAGFRLKITRSMSILADYFYVNSKYRTNNFSNPYYFPCAVGLEIETGGHVFHIDFTNAAGITENFFIPNSPDSWGKGGYKFGFNISRVFQLASKKKNKRKSADVSSFDTPVPEKTIPNSQTTATNKTGNSTNEKPEEKPAEKEKDLYKATTNLNLRVSTNAHSTLIMVISKGASVELIEKVNSTWWKIKYNDETGFVASKFLTK